METPPMEASPNGEKAPIEIDTKDRIALADWETVETGTDDADNPTFEMAPNPELEALAARLGIVPGEGDIQLSNGEVGVKVITPLDVDDSGVGTPTERVFVTSPADFGTLTTQGL